MEFFIIPSNTPAHHYSKFNNMKNPLISLKFLRVRSSEVQGLLKNDIKLIKTSRLLKTPGGMFCYAIAYPSLVRDDLDIVFLEYIPCSCLGVILGVDKAEPVLIILSRIVGLIVESRITSFFAELDVTQVRLDRPDAVEDLPAAH